MTKTKVPPAEIEMHDAIWEMVGHGCRVHIISSGSGRRCLSSAGLRAGAQAQALRWHTENVRTRPAGPHDLDSGLG